MGLELHKKNSFSGHKEPIYTLERGYKEGQIISAGGGGIVALWDTQSGEAKGLIKAPSSVYSLLKHPDDIHIYCGLRDGKILEVNTKEESPPVLIKGSEAAVFDLQLFNQGASLLSISDGKLSLWDTRPLKLHRIIPISDSSARTIAILPQEKTIAIGASDDQIYLLSFDLQPKGILRGHSNSIFRLKYDPESRFLYSTGRDAQIIVWDAANNWEKVGTIPAHMYTVNDLILMDDLPYFATASMDKSIKIWDKFDFSLLKVINYSKNKVHPFGVNRLLWWENRLYSGGDCKTVHEWSLEK